MQLELDARYGALEAFVSRANAGGIPDNVRDDLTKFGAVLVCGNIERSLEIILLSRLSHKAHPRIINFIKSHFKRGSNFDCNATAQLLSRFDTEWYRSFSRFVDANPAVREGISSCYAIRNLVAHGGSPGLGVSRLRELLTASKSMIDAIVASTAG